MKSSSVLRYGMCSSSKETLLGPKQAKERNMTLMAKDKQIFLFRNEDSEANEGREVIPKRSKTNLKTSVWIQTEKR